ncbi:MAG: hypothetical protein JO011_15155 [Ktedonobacteraceae bacterium]|nr:hypothetical protein [Ktedonobacteraceae bacterium]
MGKGIERLTVDAAPLYDTALYELQAAGCTITRMPGYDLVAYPIGATREKMNMRNREKRYKVTLIDGTEIRELYHAERELFIVWIAMK